jgi:glutamate-1-semialdehyde 2,1-aminomutase
MSRNTELFNRALVTIPWATQTNAKRHDPAMGEAMPHFIDHADGCRMTDVDGRSFIDYRNALGPIILGYKYPAVEAAVRAQLDKGVLFSMASPIEMEVTEAMCAMVPGLEQVRFMKTGNEVNTAAIRLARAKTGRSKIAICGYHGYDDWFGCGTGKAATSFPRDNNGVPTELDDLVIRLPYADTDYAREVFTKYGHELAAVLTVPYNWDAVVGHEFLEYLREATTEHGTVLIFDQVLTGFRLAKGGAQEYFGIIPDLTTYAKAVANGYPLAAFGGKSEFMQPLEHVIITTTYAGETFSLAAALATLNVMKNEPVHEHIWRQGQKIKDGFDQMSADFGMNWKSFGLAPAAQFHFSDDEHENLTLRNAFFKRLFEQGIFASRPFLVSYSHDDEAIEETLTAFKHAMEHVAELVTAQPA